MENVCAGSLRVGREEEEEMSNWNLEEVGSHWPVEVGVGGGGFRSFAWRNEHWGRCSEGTEDGQRLP